MITDNDMEDFIKGYVDSALWSSTDNSDDSGGDPLDDNYGPGDLTIEAVLSIREDCMDFINGNTADLILYMAERYADLSYAGHDFWLTRCGHGTGFWDRGLGELGERLTAAAKVYGDCYIYVGDDKKLHV